MTPKIFMLFIFSLAVFSFTIGCGPSPEQIAYEKSVDSMMRADSIAQKIISDSLARIDSIRNFPCPELAEYSRLTERSIALLRSSENNVADKFEIMADSLEAMHTILFEKTFASLDGICKHRLMALDMRYTRDMTNAIIDRSGAMARIMRDESEDAKTDSIANRIEFMEINK
jgi:hypothetical protein